MKKIFLVIILSVSEFVYSQENKFGTFELMYDIPQQMISDNFDWPKYYLEPIAFYNDTIYTLLVKKNHMTSIPLSDKTGNIQHDFLPLPVSYMPLEMLRQNNRWYFLSNSDELGYLEKKNYKSLIKGPKIRYFEHFFILNDKILLYDTNGTEGALDLYDFNGILTASSRADQCLLMNAGTYKNEIINISNKIIIKDDAVDVSKDYDYANYGDENIFVDACQNYGYFVDWNRRDHLVIRDMNDLSTKEILAFPQVFKQEYMGIPPEGETSINLRVLSEDHKTFYFCIFEAWSFISIQGGQIE